MHIFPSFRHEQPSKKQTRGGGKTDKQSKTKKRTEEQPPKKGHGGRATAKKKKGETRDFDQIAATNNGASTGQTTIRGNESQGWFGLEVMNNGWALSGQPLTTKQWETARAWRSQAQTRSLRRRSARGNIADMMA